jgi:Domain of Unknown Function (DUF1259)
MKREITMNVRVLHHFTIACAMAIVPLLWSPMTSLSGEKALDTAMIERLTEVKGELSEKEGVFKVSVPRSDLDITVAGVKMTPPLGLTSWAAFQKAGAQVMVMGDMVVLEDQVNPVMSVALENGLEVTALHNHFLWDTPKVMFMHIGGMGDEAKLAGAVGNMFTTICRRFPAELRAAPSAAPPCKPPKAAHHWHVSPLTMHSSASAFID